MQTFLPYDDFRLTAQVLDQRRLGKQRVETLQIMTALLEGRGWVNHPAVKMWAGYERALLDYQWYITQEWAVIRGFQDSCWNKTAELFDKYRGHERLIAPDWLGMDEVHLGYQSNLVRKDPYYYRRYFPTIPDDYPYYWPV